MDAKVTGVLYESFGPTRVRVIASETESITKATGATNYRFHAVSAVFAEPSGDEDLEPLAK